MVKNGQYQALSINQWQELREVSQNMSFLTQALTDVTPFAGLSMNQLGHLRADWIQWRDGYVEIDVPATDSCNDWVNRAPDSAGGQTPPQVTRRKEPCRRCRKHGDTDEFESVWYEGTTSVNRGYNVVLHEDIAEPAVGWLKRVFKTHGRPEIASSEQGVNSHLELLVDQADIEFTYRNLMRTGIVMYAEYDIELDLIEELTPYEGESISKTITQTPELTHPEIKKKCNYSQLIRVAENLGKFTCPEVADRLPIMHSSVQHKVEKLIERDRAEKVGTDDTGRGDPATIYQLTEPVHTEFECQYGECNFTSDSIRGISSHEARVH